MSENARSFEVKNRKNSGNIDSSMSVLLLEVAWPPEQQGDAAVKIILVGVAFATLMASPLLAQSRTVVGSSRSGAYLEQKSSGAYLEQKKRPHATYRDSERSARKSNQSTSNPDFTNQELCNTAPGFCSDYHGSNGG